MRKTVDLNGKWMFHKGDIHVPRPADKGPVYSQSKTQRKLIGPAAYVYSDRSDTYGCDVELRSERWNVVDLPHDYIIDQDNDPTENSANGYLKYENAWYRKHFSVAEDEIRGKRVLLQFDGIAGKSTIYLNGCLMKHNFSAYNSFEIDISDNIYYEKENVIAVYVNTEEFEGWWYQGGGIYRDVRLVITEPIAIDRYGVYAPVRKIDGENWAVDFETTLVNDYYEDCEFEADSSIIDADGRVVAEACGYGKALLREKGTAKYTAAVEKPDLWDTEQPNLYTVRTVLKICGMEIDCDTTRIGFRTIAADPEKGFFLNGKHTVIKGVCAHQDFGLTGLAVPDNVTRYKISLFKEMGANGFRTSHYMNSSVSMDCFDELGFLVMDETRWFETTDEATEQLEELVKRDRNRPSVIFWSTGNEEPYHATDVGNRIQKAMAAKIRKLDNTRFITAAEDKTPDRSCIFDECDVIGINYNLDLFDTVHKQRPNIPVFSSECCATGTTRDWILPANANGRVTDRDADTNSWFRGREYTWKFLMERPYVMGAFQWAAVEHRGEAMWPAVCSKSGALDLFLQKKGAFYQNKSHWTDEPMAHISGHWNRRGLEGQEVLVTVYTNCDSLELFLNGKSLGRKNIEKYGHGEWNVIYEPGELSVKGYRGEMLVAEDIQRTSGAPVKLRLRLLNEVTANGKDMALICCECLDENGLVVPDAEETVSFFAALPARVVATGSDNCDHKRVGNTERKMYAGKIATAVQPAKGQKTIEVFAQSEHCGISVLHIPLK